MDSTQRTLLVKRKLKIYKDLVDQIIKSTLPKKQPRRHLYDLLPSYPNRGGKGFRPGLCLATCKAFGGNINRAMHTAASLELFHNAFLVHDDVEDDSDFRRGLPTLNAEHGVGIAVNVGDAMNVFSLRSVMRNVDRLGPDMTWRVLSEIDHMLRESVEGQAIELGWVKENQCQLTEDDYLRMTLKKTCWYTCIHPCRLGALISTGGVIDLDRFNRFGYYMGAAFQIQDDLLNLIGDEEKYGKEIGGDILEGKRTLMLIHLLNHCSNSENTRLQAFLAKPRQERSEIEVRWVFDKMVEYGALEFARRGSRQLAGAALREFFIAYGEVPESEDKKFIQNIILYMIERDL
jgi:geranylgeranyl diphosphate synthase type II